MMNTYSNSPSVALCPACQNFDIPATHICPVAEDSDSFPEQFASWTPESIDEFLA